jgi:hypothetical protein
MTAYKVCKLYSVNSGTISAHLRGITKSEKERSSAKIYCSTRTSSFRLIFQLASCLTNEAAMNLLGAEAAEKAKAY